MVINSHCFWTAGSYICLTGCDGTWLMHPRWLKRESGKRKTRKWQVVPGVGFLHVCQVPSASTAGSCWRQDRAWLDPGWSFLCSPGPSLHRHLWVNASLTQTGQRARLTLHYYFNNFDAENTRMAFGPADGFSSSWNSNAGVLHLVLKSSCVIPVADKGLLSDFQSSTK